MGGLHSQRSSSVPWERERRANGHRWHSFSNRQPWSPEAQTVRTGDQSMEGAPTPRGLPAAGEGEAGAGGEGIQTWFPGGQPREPHLPSGRTRVLASRGQTQVSAKACAFGADSFFLPRPSLATLLLTPAAPCALNKAGFSPPSTRAPASQPSLQHLTDRSAGPPPLRGRAGRGEGGLGRGASLSLPRH